MVIDFIYIEMESSWCLIGGSCLIGGQNSPTDTNKTNHFKILFFFRFKCHCNAQTLLEDPFLHIKIERKKLKKICI